MRPVQRGRRRPPARPKYEKHDRYRGWYRDGQTVTIELRSWRRRFSHWLVNGEVVEGERLEVRITGETTITPVFPG